MRYPVEPFFVPMSLAFEPQVAVGGQVDTFDGVRGTSQTRPTYAVQATAT